ncbi:MAG: hypothetical protein HYY57_02190 [Candidatus Omnitrophica bacterium]|nr:hypothetical protein [Candidatus Omnitrophota bacterium]
MDAQTGIVQEMPGFHRGSLGKRRHEARSRTTGKLGALQRKSRPVSWVRYNANPQIKLLRRKRKGLPLIHVRSTPRHIHLALSTEQ